MLLLVWQLEYMVGLLQVQHQLDHWAASGLYQEQLWERFQGFHLA